ncbi:MAG: glycosyltransferase 87 family protein [Oligoflexia bacterium]|nr:glycosyltransferase 87 family protein [Oligoflexia bacterium]
MSGRKLDASPEWAFLKAWGPKILGGGILLLCAAALGSRYLTSERLAIPGDFAVYLRAWQRAQAGLDPYVATDFSPYKYAPGVLFLFSLLPADPNQAWMAFGAASIAAFLAAILIGVRLESWRSVGLLLVGLALSWKGVLETLDYGQLEFLILLLATLAARLYAFWPATAGFLLGLLPGFKLPWILFFLPFVLRALSHAEIPYPRNRFYRRLASGYFLAWFFWAAALPSLIFGPERAKELSQSWLKLLQLQPKELYLSDINQSLFSFGLRLTGENPERVLALMLLASGALLAILIRRNRGYDPRCGALAWITPWLLFTQLANPLAWRWGSVFAVGAPLCARRSWGWGLVLVLWLLQQTPVVKLLGFSHWTDLHGYGVITLYWLALVFA